MGPPFAKCCGSCRHQTLPEYQRSSPLNIKFEQLKIEEQQNLDESALNAVFNLWNNEYPVNISFDSLIDLQEYLHKLSNKTHFLIILEHIIVGWAITFDRADEKWFAIIVSDKMQRKGIGRRILEILKTREPILYGWVIDHNNYKRTNGEMYFSPVKFYEQCGFKVISNARHELDKISAVQIRWTRSIQ
jgi:GNAT superfamily N-acetyltransferase